MYYVYVLRSVKDRRLYIGHTHDLRRRFRKHTEGNVESTRVRRPLELIYYEACRHEQDAVLREQSLKTGFGRAYLKRRLAHDRGN